MKIKRIMKTRLLVQFLGDNPFGEELQELGVFENFNDAVDMAISLIDHTVKNMLINDGVQWVRIRQ